MLPTYRAEKNKREVIGTGLGLSIVKQILKRHNFKFGVRSEIGAGSTFWFEVKGRAVEEKGEKERVCSEPAIVTGTLL